MKIPAKFNLAGKCVPKPSLGTRVKVMELSYLIAQIGERIVNCNHICAGVTHDQPKGLPPRGLYLEEGFGPSGVIVCGMNPGNAPPHEIEFFKSKGTSYSSLYECWKSRFMNIPYFSRMRKLVRALGYDGPILWTNVAKCEKRDDSERMSFDLYPHTFRFCASTYMAEEIKNVPDSWLLMANGKDAFVALSYLFPNRKLIGVPHSTGAYPQFSKLWLNEKLHPEAVEGIESYFSKEPKGAFWIRR
jgi:hypothetical protein